MVVLGLIVFKQQSGSGRRGPLTAAWHSVHAGMPAA
jgi:hypothetical protein